jgi:hypothetical protein
MELKDSQPIATFLAAIVTGVISAVVLWKLQAKKENSDIDLTILNNSLDEKLEKFKITLVSDLSKKANLHRLQVEKEFEAYSKIWEKAARAMLACQDLRLLDKGGFTQENIINEAKRLREANQCIDDLLFEVQRQRPFYPTEFYKELGILLHSNTQTLRDFVLIKYEMDSKTSKVINIRQMTDTERQRGEENLKKVLEVLGGVCELMRSRMSGN